MHSATLKKLFLHFVLRSVAAIIINLIKTSRMAAAIFKATLEETDKRDVAWIGYRYGRERLKLAFVMAFAGVYLLGKFRSVLGARKSEESRVPVSGNGI